MIKRITEQYPDDEIITCDGFDGAIIGIDLNSDSIRVIYSVSKCLEILEKDMDGEEAMEFFTFNVSGAYIGDKTPIWCWDNFLSEAEKREIKIDEILED
jgi:hypothetical protein